MNDGLHKKTISDAELMSATWFPKKIYELDSAWHIDWKFIGDKRFTEPFYQDTLARIFTGTRQQFTSSVKVLESSQTPSFQTAGPSAFIFHVSRCGSTLLTQMLSQIPENIVISEAPVIDQLIRSGLPKKTKSAYLKKLMQLLCRKRFPEEQYSFIKFDAWHILYFDEIRSQFPNVPVLIIYRNPGDILFSHAKMRGEHMVPGFFNESIIRVDKEDYANLNGYAAKVIQMYFETILSHHSQKGAFLLNYKEMTNNIWSFLYQYMQISFQNDKIREMAKRARYYSKNRNQNFSGDSRNGLSDHPKNMNLLNSLYEELEKQREKQRIKNSSQA